MSANDESTAPAAGQSGVDPAVIADGLMAAGPDNGASDSDDDENGAKPAGSAGYAPSLPAEEINRILNAE